MSAFESIISTDAHTRKYAIAVKALVTRPSINASEILVLRNALDDPNRPGEADFPGGRLELGEDPYLGLKREFIEELGNEVADAIEIGLPLDVDHFERPDGQVVTMIFFHCVLKGNPEIKISAEHSAYKWVNIMEAETSVHYKMRRAYYRLLGL